MTKSVWSETDNVRIT